MRGHRLRRRAQIDGSSAPPVLKVRGSPGLSVSAPLSASLPSRTPRWASSMIFSANILVAASSIIFKLNASQTFRSASDISRIVSGSKGWPARNGRIGIVSPSVESLAKTQATLKSSSADDARRKRGLIAANIAKLPDLLKSVLPSSGPLYLICRMENNSRIAR
jgi:hypothetical protein